MVFDQTLPLLILREILHRKGFNYGIPRKHNTYVEVVVIFPKEPLEVKELPARLEFFICSTEVYETRPSLVMPDLNFSFKSGRCVSIIPDYLR